MSDLILAYIVNVNIYKCIIYASGFQPFVLWPVEPISDFLFIYLLLEGWGDNII